MYIQSKMVASIGFGQVGEFDENKKNFDTYSEHVKLFLKANKVDAELQVAAFLSLVGVMTYDLVQIVTPDKKEDKSLGDLFSVLKGHFIAEPLEIVECFKFQQRLRRPGEGAVQYMAALKQLSVSCNFGQEF